MNYSLFFLPAIFLGIFSGFGITGGAHRLWSHRTYKAKWPLRLIVALGQTIALQVIIKM
jgi:stearoyl-CoA desaturase (delta-9 desaturase)